MNEANVLGSKTILEYIRLGHHPSYSIITILEFSHRGHKILLVVIVIIISFVECPLTTNESASLLKLFIIPSKWLCQISAKCSSLVMLFTH